MNKMFLKRSAVVAVSTVMALMTPLMGLAQFPGDFSNTFTIKVVHTIYSVDFTDPNGPANSPAHPAWTSAPVTHVPLQYQIVANVNNLATGKDTFYRPDLQRILSVQAIHDGTNIAFKVEFSDTTRNTSIADVSLFHDALAILIPYPTTLYGEQCTPGKGQRGMIHMGAPCNGEGGLPCCPVNIMFWRADKGEIENIIANSPGTAQESFETDEPGMFNTFQSWHAWTWTVILGRRMLDFLLPNNNVSLPYPFMQSQFPGRNMVDLVPGQKSPVVFANWDGAKGERNGIKFIGTWGVLDLQL